MTRPLNIFSALATILAAGAAIAADDHSGVQLPEGGEAWASIDLGDTRFDRSPKTDTPLPQKPEPATTQNVDTGKPFWEWASATDDWAGLRPRLDDRGITFQANLTYDGSAVLGGGATQRVFASRDLINANVTLDFDRLAGWKGLTLFANYQSSGGRDGSADAGAFQAISNIDARSLNQISEVWAEQQFGEILRVKVGKIDLSTEFASVPNAAEFINASMGFSPTIVNFPTYPDGAFGGLISVSPERHLYVRLGIFDGSAQEGFRTGSRGPSTLFGAPSDLFLIAEGGVLWDAKDRALPGSVTIGAWRHTGTFDRFDGGSESGTNGVYLVINQTLWQPDDEAGDEARGLTGFLQLGLADGAVSEVTQHIGAGLTWKGLVPGRQEDAFGLGVTWVDFADAAGLDEAGELIVEAFYKFQLTPFFSIKPDVQYMHTPGGDGSLKDAFVAGVRCVIEF